MVPRLAMLVLGAMPAVAQTNFGISNALLRGSGPELVQQAAGSSGAASRMARGLGGEDPKGGSYEHVGCFADNKGDRILGSKLVSSQMSAMECHTHCDGMAAAYMATQFGDECWCSREGLLDYERHGDGIGKCDYECAGDKMETCGGRDAFDLYRLEWAPAPTGSEYKGCYKDVKDDRLMDDLMRLDNLTPDLCREHCMGKGVKTYATQYANECWCGTSDNMKDYTKHGEGVCHMRCTGDKNVACGGYNALSLFQMTDMGTGGAPTPAPETVGTDELGQPAAQPTSSQPTVESSSAPTMEPTSPPSMGPTSEPTMEPTSPPAAEPTMEPTSPPTAEPTSEPTMEPTSPPAAEPTSEPTSDGGVGGSGGDRESGGGGNAGDYAELLSIHNEKRCMHNADPLVWDDTLFGVAKAYAATLTNSKNCGSIFHSTDNNYGENLHYCGNTAGYGCYSDEEAMTGLFDEELTNNVATYGLHATQIAWKSTKRVGCAVDTCKGSNDYYYHTLVCNYDPPGNYLAKLLEEVEPASKSESQCS